MPLYDYLCDQCGKTTEHYNTIENRDRGPKCCGKRTKKQISRAHVAPLFNAYRVVGAEYGRVIRSKQEHRDYLKQHGYVEVGSDPSMAPPPFDPDREAAKERETREAFADLSTAEPFVDSA